MVVLLLAGGSLAVANQGAGSRAVGQRAAVRRADVMVYSGTCAAVVAAMQVRKMGKSVIIVSPDKLTCPEKLK